MQRDVLCVCVGGEWGTEVNKTRAIAFRLEAVAAVA